MNRRFAAAPSVKLGAFLRLGKDAGFTQHLHSAHIFRLA